MNPASETATRRFEILRKVQSTPSINTTAIKVFGLLLDPNVTTAELLRTIEYDPALTSNILRLANSAFFGAPRTIETVEQAIVRLGTTNILQLVMTVAAAPAVQKSVPGYELKPGELWLHSVAVATAAAKLGELLKLSAPVYTYTAGLLHDLGKLVIGPSMEQCKVLLQTAERGEGLSSYAAELRVLGIHHAEAGAALLHNWNLPAVLVAAVRYSHEPENITDGTELVPTLILAADTLCRQRKLGAAVDSPDARMSDFVQKRLNLTPQALDQTVEYVGTQLENARGLFAGN